MNESPTVPAEAAREDDQPLAGLRVLAVENFIAGPFCSMWLGDAGAEVVKIETPDGGDYSRATSPRKVGADGIERGLSFLRSNRNKKSVTLDLKSPSGRDVFLQLVAKADVLVENLRPGVMEKLGCGWDVLHALNPRLVYVAISGFGHIDVMPSPFSDRPAFDVMGQALAGLMNRPERQGDKPVYLGFSLADIQGGILGAYGAMLALFQRGTSGVGRKVDISLYDACLALNEISVTMFSVTRERTKPGVHAVSAPFGSYKAADGYIVIAVLGEHIWERFCNSMGRPDLLLDEGFKDGVSRQRNLERLDQCINHWLSGLTRAEAVATLLANGVPASTVNDIDDIFECPHVAARKMLVPLDDPSWGQVTVAGNPVKLSGVPERKPSHPPDLGTHTEEVLQGWLGADEKQVADWRAAGGLGSSK